MALEESILNTTKKILGIDAEDDAFDLDILIHINNAFSSLTQLGVGPVEGFMIEDKESKWDSYSVPLPQLSKVKTYIYLKVRYLFDPPTMGYLVEAMDKQIKEAEWRLNVFREDDLYESIES